MKVAIIGSGLASYASCIVLEKKKIIPDVYDVGEDIPKEIENFKLRLKKKFGNWSRLNIQMLNNFSKTEKNKFPRKKLFGSDFIYNYYDKSDLRNNPSFSNAFGGFSNVWSASALFPNVNDLKNWPKKALPKLSIYKKYFMHLPYTSENDNLEKYFPNLKKNFDKIQYDEKIVNLKKKLNDINDNNFITGSPRIFIETKKKDLKCKFCGYCMTGCVFDSIFNSKIGFKELINNKKINYFKNHEVVELKKIKNKVRIYFKESNKFVDYDKVFVGAGALSTTRIILNSLKKIKKVSLNHAALFVIPLISLKSFFFKWPKMNTLSKIFIELRNNKKDNWSHFQLNQPSEIVMNKMRYFQFNFFPFNIFYRFIFKRLFTLTGTLHSNLSGKYVVSLSKKNHKLNIKYIKNTLLKKNIKKIYSLLSKKLLQVKFFSSSYLINFGSKADNYYLGGSFPMREKVIKNIHTNILGEFKNLKSVHLIDSSIFPSIPATTLGLLIMLNSARITDKVFEK
jgi:hypothetical protein